MSERASRAAVPSPLVAAIGWAAVAAAAGCTVVLYLLVREGFEQRDAVTMVLLLHGAQLTAAFAHGLSWRATGSALHWSSAWACYVTTLGWLYTWFEPAQAWLLWGRNMGQLIFEIGPAW